MKQAIIQRLCDLEEYRPNRRVRALLCNEASDIGRERFKADMMDKYPEDDLVFIMITSLLDVRNEWKL